MPDGTQIAAKPSALTCEGLEAEDDIARCENCDVPETDLYERLEEGWCRECLENSEDTSISAMRREHGTW